MKVFEIMKIAEANKEGFTIELKNLKHVTNGICVAYKETQNSFDSEGLKQCVEHAERHHGYIGGWFNDDNGKFYFDSVRIFPVTELDEAIRFGKANEQISIFDLTNLREIRL
jgi:hypothetical protein